MAPTFPFTASTCRQGIHMPPSTNPVDINVLPGQFRLYDFTVPLFHVPGLRWYSPHGHRAAYLFNSSCSAGQLAALCGRTCGWGSSPREVVLFVDPADQRLGEGTLRISP